MYEVQVNGKSYATLGKDNKLQYPDPKASKEIIQEIIAGKQVISDKASAFANIKVVYVWDKNREKNNTEIHRFWKDNTLIQQRIRVMNSLVFGRGFQYSYEGNTKEIIDQFWRINRLRKRLSPMSTNAQLYGEVFIALFPQKSGHTLISVYESNQVQIDFSPANVDDVNQYLVGYKDEETKKDVVLSFLPIDKYFNEQELSSPAGKIAKKIKKMLSSNQISGHDGVMIHIKFNNSSSEVYGTSDFRQAYPVINDYMDFRSDRMTIHQMYGSPMFDIEIDTDDEKIIEKRIEELAGFSLGDNPVHNKSEKWTPFEFKGNADSAEYDEKAMRGLICAGTGLPENIQFNQGTKDTSDEGAFTLYKMAEDMQDAFGEAITDMHRFVISTAGEDYSKIEDGQLIFPEISIMSEKSKAETYVLKVGASICSRRTASYNTGHNWTIEQKYIEEEQDMFAVDSNMQGVLGGRFSSRINNQEEGRDDGTTSKNRRGRVNNIKDQTFGNGRKDD